MTANDSKIINDNPNKTIYELKMLGLSEKGAEEYAKNILTKPNPKPVQPTNKLVASSTEPTKAHIAMPHLSQTLPTQQKAGMALVYNKNTGLKKPMTLTAATRLVRLQGDVYKIVG